jgi:hypothetical protein
VIWSTPAGASVAVQEAVPLLRVVEHKGVLPVRNPTPPPVGVEPLAVTVSV